jgi:hypothetical protein
MLRVLKIYTIKYYVYIYIYIHKILMCISKTLRIYVTIMYTNFYIIGKIFWCIFMLQFYCKTLKMLIMIKLC